MQRSEKETSFEVAEGGLRHVMASCGIGLPVQCTQILPQRGGIDIHLSGLAEAQIAAMKRALGRMGIASRPHPYSFPPNVIYVGQDALPRLDGMVERDSQGEPDYRRSHDLHMFTRILQEEMGLTRRGALPPLDRDSKASRSDDVREMLEDMMSLLPGSVQFDVAKTGDETRLFLPHIDPRKRLALATALYECGFDVRPDSASLPEAKYRFARQEMADRLPMEALHNEPEEIVIRGNAEPELAAIAFVAGNRNKQVSAPYRALADAYRAGLEAPHRESAWQRFVVSQGERGRGGDRER